MKHGEAPWFLMWSSALLFAFGMFWAWLVDIGAARTVMVLDTPVQSALLVGAGILGTILGQLGMRWPWRHHVRAAKEMLATDATPRAMTSDETTDRTGHAIPSAGSGEARHPGPPFSP